MSSHSMTDWLEKLQSSDWLQLHSCTPVAAPQVATVCGPLYRLLLCSPPHSVHTAAGQLLLLLL